MRLRTRGDIRSGPPGVLNPLYTDTGALLADQQNIIAFETFAQAGPWSLQGEYAGTWIQDAVQPAGVDHGTPFFHGGYVELLYFLTGDCRTFNKQLAIPDRTVPLENAFLVRTADGCSSGRGAWQLGVRYSAVDLNDNGINGGILNSGTLGLNWFPNPNTIVQFNYDLTHRSQVLNTPDGFINGFGADVVQLLMNSAVSEWSGSPSVALRPTLYCRPCFVPDSRVHDRAETAPDCSRSRLNSSSSKIARVVAEQP